MKRWRYFFQTLAKQEHLFYDIKWRCEMEDFIVDQNVEIIDEKDKLTLEEK